MFKTILVMIITIIIIIDSIAFFKKMQINGVDGDNDDDVINNNMTMTINIIE